jgi:NDP-sugar pyrophosphorylase family protein
MTIATHEEPIQIPFGRLEINGERVVAYEEKPHVPVRISSGVYALNQRAIEMIEPDQRVDVPDLVTKLLAHGESVAAWAHSAQWVDVNNERARARAEYLMSENDAVSGVELPKEARG